MGDTICPISRFCLFSRFSLHFFIMPKLSFTTLFTLFLSCAASISSPVSASTPNGLYDGHGSFIAIYIYFIRVVALSSPADLGIRLNQICTVQRNILMSMPCYASTCIKSHTQNTAIKCAARTNVTRARSRRMLSAYHRGE